MSFTLTVEDIVNAVPAFPAEFLRLLREYIEGNDVTLKNPADFLSLKNNLSPFTVRVLSEACKISYGETISYAELAQRIGCPKAIRATGTALGKNPLPIIIPCHRVISKSGSLGGYAFGIDLKGKLLLWEQKYSIRHSLDF